MTEESPWNWPQTGLVICHMLKDSSKVRKAPFLSVTYCLSSSTEDTALRSQNLSIQNFIQNRWILVNDSKKEKQMHARFSLGFPVIEVRKTVMFCLQAQCKAWGCMYLNLLTKVSLTGGQ